MSTRTSSAAALLLVLAACAPDAAVSASADGEDLIACALAGAASFARACAVERSRSDEGTLLVIRHPDGGFRRFVATTDRLGIAPADGAEPATLVFRDQDIEVAVGADRYRIPTAMITDGSE